MRERIASGEWPIGSRIPTEPELSAELGVGRSTIREAVRSLASLGMVEALTARGTFVRATTPAPAVLLDALSVYSSSELIGCRRALDVEAAQAAAARRTEDDVIRLDAMLAEQLRLVREVGDAAPPSCPAFHAAIASASGNRLLTELGGGLSGALGASGLDARIAGSLDPARVIDEHDKILTAIRDRDVARVAHLMAMHLDGALRTLSSDPVVTDLTALVGFAPVEAMHVHPHDTGAAVRSA
jgi:DNA-binding FadR family transcriptional regulator